MRHQLCTDTWWITMKNLFNLLILGLWEGWIMLPVICIVEFTISFLRWRVFFGSSSVKVLSSKLDGVVALGVESITSQLHSLSEYLIFFNNFIYNFKTCFFLMSGVWWIGQSGHLSRERKKTEISLRIIVMCDPSFFIFKRLKTMHCLLKYILVLLKRSVVNKYSFLFMQDPFLLQFCFKIFVIIMNTTHYLLLTTPKISPLLYISALNIASSPSLDIQRTLAQF